MVTPPCREPQLNRCAATPIASYRAATGIALLVRWQDTRYCSLLQSKSGCWASVRFEAVNAIAYAMQAKPDLSHSLAEDVVRLLDAQDPRVEASAIEALGYVARVDRELAISMTPRLLERLTDTNMQVREAAGMGLGHLMEGDFNLAPVVVPALLELFQSENTGVQASAARALARVAKSARDRAAEA